MNYPFKKDHSHNFRRILTLAMVLVLMTTVLTGCFSRKEPTPSEEPTEDTPSLIETNTAPATEPTAPPETEPEETEPEQNNLAIVKEQLNIRISPSTGANINHQADAGETVEVLRVETVNGVKWAYITADNNRKGWVSADLLDMSNVTAPLNNNSTPAGGNEQPAENTTNETSTGNAGGNGTMGVVMGSELNIRSEPSTGADRVGSLNYGDRVTIQERKDGWGRISKGWIFLDYVYIDGNNGKNTCTGTVSATQLIVRSGPGTTYDQVNTLNNGARVEVLEQVTVGNRVWGCIQGGWIAMDYVTATSGSILSGGQNQNAGTTNNGATNNGTGVGTGTVTGNGLNIRSGAGTNYEIVGALKQGDTVTILEKTEADGRTWGKVSQGWIAMDYVRMN